MINEQYLLITIIGLLVLVGILLVIQANQRKTSERKIKESLDQLNKDVTRLDQANETNLSHLSQNTENMRQNVNNSLTEIERTLWTTLHKMSEEQNQKLTQMDYNLSTSLVSGMDKMRAENDEKLDEMRKTVNEKLDHSLNERLDNSFARITDQLKELYNSLGELSAMSNGINSLNRTLSNVKTRGTWGEAQLRDIIRETMVPSQYEENVITKKETRDPVEFAIKIPSKDGNGQFLYLPIDSKFPMDVYNHVVDAAQKNDPEALHEAVNQLEQRVKAEAKKIHDKYISVPETTNFAVLYLPTESLYAEVLRINGLAESCQNEYSIMIAGPSTITALLNSLRMGFQNLTLSRKAEDVRKLLGAIKAQYENLNELIDKTSKKLAEAAKSNEELKRKTNTIQRKMKAISDDMSTQESNQLLGLDDEDENPPFAV